jgi:hypothetical protein
MTAPVVEAVSTWAVAGSGNATNWGQVTLPTGIVAGDLLLAIVSSDGSTELLGSATWHRLKTRVSTFIATGAVFWRVADGVADGLAITSTWSERGTAIVYRISGANFVEGSSADNASSNPTPAAFTPTNTGLDAVWVAALSVDDAIVATVPPSGYGDLVTRSDVPAGASTSAAHKTGTTAAETPGAWTMAYENWNAFTLAVYQAPQLAGTVLDASGDPLAADLMVLDRDALVAYSHGEYTVPLRSNAAGAFALGVRGPSREFTLVALDPTDTLSDLVVSRVTPV